MSKSVIFACPVLTKQYNNLHSRPIMDRDNNSRINGKKSILQFVLIMLKKAVCFVVLEDDGVERDLRQEMILLKELIVNFRMLAKWDKRRVSAY